MPVYNVEEKWLRRAVESVLNQSYQNWELCIADDNSSLPHIKPILEEYSREDIRLKVVFRQKNGHISAASNSALKLATGDFIALLDNDDELEKDALLYVAKEILDHTDAALIYSDEDKIDEKNNHFDPTFKPDWNADLIYSLNFINHLAVFRRDILTKIAGFRTAYDGSQDYDLILRFTEQIGESQIRHIPQVLYHWRTLKSSVAFDSSQKNYAREAARGALRESLQRKAVKAEVIRGYEQYHRVLYDAPIKPRVSLIIEKAGFNRNYPETVLSFLNYENPEIIIVSEIGAKEEKIPVGVNKQIKFSKHDFRLTSRARRLNESAKEATGDILIFIDEDLQPLDKNWLDEITRQTGRAEIGAVSGKILYADNSVRFAGFILNAETVFERAHHRFPRKAPGNLARLQVASNFPAVSIEFLAVKRDDFFKHSGFDEKNFPNSLFDIDFCLRLEESKKRNLLVPYVEFQSGKRFEKDFFSKAEKENFMKKWQLKLIRAINSKSR